MPQASDVVRAAGWRQGSIARPADNETLLAASVDRVPEPGESVVRLVAVTQACDLVQEPDIEPFVEFTVCRETQVVEPLYRHRRNPRLLHLRTVGETGPGPRLNISIHDRFRIGKETLTATAVDAEFQLNPSDVRLLGRWIAKRYTRPAFPDAFNARLVDLDIIICVSGGGDGEPTAELAMPVVEHVLGDSVHAGVDNPPRTGYGRLQMTTSQTARSDPAAPFGAR